MCNVFGEILLQQTAAETAVFCFVLFCLLSLRPPSLSPPSELISQVSALPVAFLCCSVFDFRYQQQQPTAIIIRYNKQSQSQLNGIE